MRFGRHHPASAEAGVTALLQKGYLQPMVELSRIRACMHTHTHLHTHTSARAHTHARTLPLPQKSYRQPLFEGGKQLPPSLSLSPSLPLCLSVCLSPLLFLSYLQPLVEVLPYVPDIMRELGLVLVHGMSVGLFLCNFSRSLSV